MRVSGYLPLASRNQKRWALSLMLTLFGGRYPLGLKKSWYGR